MLENYEINSIEQLRAIADIRRVRILELLEQRSMTVTQIAEVLGEVPAKMHYHVRELEKVGLLKLVETREKGGILEKYYQPIARSITVSKSLFLLNPPDETVAAMSVWFETLKEGFQQALRSAIEQKDEHLHIFLDAESIYVTEEEAQQLFQQMQDLLKPYKNKRDIPGEQAIETVLIGYPRMSTPVEQPATTQPTIEHVWVVGVTNFDRAELENVIARGSRLNINVTGLCSFASDVTPELADQAIDRLSLLGKLNASPAVREILLKKRS